jgi:hypothetical protein
MCVMVLTGLARVTTGKGHALLSAQSAVGCLLASFFEIAL